MSRQIRESEASLLHHGLTLSSSASATGRTLSSDCGPRGLRAGRVLTVFLGHWSAGGACLRCRLYVLILAHHGELTPTPRQTLPGQRARPRAAQGTSPPRRGPRPGAPAASQGTRLGLQRGLCPRERALPCPARRA